MTSEERAQAKKYVAIWKDTAEELDRMKWTELRELTEMQSAEYFTTLDMGEVEAWRSPERREASGLVEQQRWFCKAHEARRGS